MPSRIRALVPVASAVGLGALLSAAALQETLLVLSKGERMLAVVDPATLHVVARVPSGPDPHEVIASADGRTAWISNYGGGTGTMLTPVDLVTQAARPPIDLGALRGPHGLAFAGGKLWFTAEGAKVVGSIDPATNRVDLVVGTGQDRTHMLIVSDDARRIVTTNAGSATVGILEKTDGATASQSGRPQDGWVQTVVPAGRGVEGFDISPDGREVWAANAQDGTITVIDLASKRATQTIAADVSGANRLKFTPDGTRVLVSRLRDSAVAIFDAATRREVKRLPVGHGAAGILVQPDGARAYVACTPDDYVAVIDLKSLTVTGRIEAGTQPDGLAWTVRP